MSITQTVLDNKTDLGIIFVSQFAVAIPYQFPKHAMSIYANKHTSIDKPRQCTLGKASGRSDGAASSSGGGSEPVKCRGSCGGARTPVEVCGR